MSFVHTRTDPMEFLECLVSLQTRRQRERLRQAARKPLIKPTKKTLPAVLPVKPRLSAPSVLTSKGRLSAMASRLPFVVASCFDPGQVEVMLPADPVEQPLGLLKQIMLEIAEKHQVTVLDIKSHRRCRASVSARQEFYYRARTETTRS